MKIQYMMSTGVGVLLVSKVEVSGDNIELNFWKRRKREDDSNRCFRFRFSNAGKTQTRFQFLFVETAGMVKRERHVVNGNQRSWFSQNHFEMR